MAGIGGNWRETSEVKQFSKVKILFCTYEILGKISTKNAGGFKTNAVCA